MKGIKENIKEVINTLLGMSAREVLAYWISQELKEAELYHELYEMSKEGTWDETISRLFYQLYLESLEHAETALKEFNGRFEGALSSPELPPIKVEYLEKKLKGIVYKRNLREILEVLIETEKMTAEIYRRLGSKAEDEEKRTFLWIAKVEEGRYLRLKDVYETLFPE